LFKEDVSAPWPLCGEEDFTITGIVGYESNRIGDRQIIPLDGFPFGSVENDFLVNLIQRKSKLYFTEKRSNRNFPVFITSDTTVGDSSGESGLKALSLRTVKRWLTAWPIST
jgi:hypothetical protein